MTLKLVCKNVFSAASLISSGMSFQRRGALMAMTQSPLDLSLNFGLVTRAPPENLMLSDDSYGVKVF